MEHNENVDDSRKTSSSALRKDATASQREPSARKESASLSKEARWEREGDTSSRSDTSSGMESRWRELRTKLSRKYDHITEDDLDEFQGRRKEDLVGFIGERVGGDRSAIARDVDNLARETSYRWE